MIINSTNCQKSAEEVINTRSGKEGFLSKHRDVTAIAICALGLIALTSAMAACTIGAIPLTALIGTAGVVAIVGIALLMAIRSVE